MRDAQAPVTFYRKDYQAPNHRILTTHLHFKLNANRTVVHSKLTFERWSEQTPANAPLVLDGEELELLEVRLNGQELTDQQFQKTDTTLSIPCEVSSGELELTVAICPEKNTRLEGLYVSNGNYFTQCEAQGFRRITYFPDRPDVLSRFTVTLEHDTASHPVALSNGNLLDQKDLGNGWAQTRWEDPFPKPSYLFALVAGQFECQEETITRGNGKPALLQVWVEPGNLDKTDFAMQSLKRSVQWDRERFGLELDLDRFMIVATADFNMGAMENKGLNIFNTRFVFANPKLATDIDFEHVESVVGHEYFHNWTGNRVTCRDWFQLSLKEGLTVFRDQEFTGDMLATGLDQKQAASARAVKRIDDVKVLRSAQFPEDAGPMAHPIRPDSYQEINNFYTITVYEKGAEVIRMQHTLLGEKGFQRGMQIYFERYDGQAVTCDDFVDCMEAALQEEHPERDLKQFRHWYEQAGTPKVQATWQYVDDSERLVLTLKQNCAPTPGQASKPVFHIPVRVGLVDPRGQDVPLNLANEPNRLHGEVLALTKAEEQFEFANVPKGSIPSVLRGFSAPVRLETQHSLAELEHLARFDSDAFNRWDAAQEVYTRAILDIMENKGSTQSELVKGALRVFESTLHDDSLADGYKALGLQLPSEGALFEATPDLVDPVALHLAKANLRDLFAVNCHPALNETYLKRADKAPYAYNAIDAGKRALKNGVLVYLTSMDGAADLAQAQCEQATHMTDRIAALTCLV
ncbi:MAG: aminopeptidase N, partial [Limnobacter sp.]|nr:aminopeptidase N [Limnobacter sp.]